MQNFKLLINSVSDNCALTSTYTGGGSEILPVANVQKYGNSKIFRSSHPNTYTLTKINGNFSGLTNVNLFAFVRHNLAEGDTFQISLYDGPDGAGTEVFNTSMINDGVSWLTAAHLIPLDQLNWGVDPLNSFIQFYDSKRKISHVYFPTVLCKSFIITISKLNVGTFDLARLYVGVAVETELNSDYGLSLSQIDESIQTRTAGGGMWCNSIDKYRKLQFSLSDMSAQDRFKMFEVFGIVGKTKDFFVSMMPDDGSKLEYDHAFAAKFVNSPEFANSSYSNYSSKFEIEEV